MYESIEGKEEKPDNANTTVMEDTLRQKVRKMRDEVLIKILLQGILPSLKRNYIYECPKTTTISRPYVNNL